MQAKIVHFGSDECSRVLVLQGAGYAVSVCGTSIGALKGALLQGATDAVIVSEIGTECIQEAVSVSRLLSSAPLVLFEDVIGTEDTSIFDLTIPPLSSPSEWLREIAQLIANSSIRAKEVAAGAGK